MRIDEAGSLDSTGTPTVTVASSSSTPRNILKHDVFLSFSGEDTGNTFTDHLRNALGKKGIDAFGNFEKKLERGQAVSPGHLKAIQGSKFAAVIFSKNYASSTWCLDVLAHIVQCKLRVFPVFYHVEPSDVKKEGGDFGKAIKEAFQNNPDKVKNWREALREVATISGWHVQDGNHESKVTEDIAEKISKSLLDFQSNTSLIPNIEKVKSCLDLKTSDEVRTIGIWGMGGIGKTKLAQQVVKDICDQFEYSLFIDHVKEKSRTHGLVYIQKDLVKTLLDSSNADIPDVDAGIRLLSHRLRHLKVLIVLDDVDYMEQIKSLADDSWLGAGSRVIITAQDKDTLIKCGVVHDNLYEVEKLTHGEAFQLLCKKAFGQNHAPNGHYKELSDKFVEYASGLPLAVEVLGSFLNGKALNHWSSALATLEQHPRKGIDAVLEIGLDGLEHTEQEIFLDIACFFQGEDQRRVEKILESCEFDPKNGIPDLVSKSLLRIERNKLWMHDLIQKMGQNFVVQKFPDRPGKRSRLWVDVFAYKRTKSWHDEVLNEKKGTNVVEGMFLCLPSKEEIDLTSHPYRKMHNLRLLKISNANFSKCPEFFSEELRLLEWHEYPLESLPANFQPSDLVELKMPNSQIKQLWQDGISLMDKLVEIDLSNCQCLTKSPDLSKVPNLEVLILEGCKKLSELHPTIWGLEHLVLLNLKGCECLESLPHSICLKSLRTFILSGCSKLEVFPEIEGNRAALSELHLDGTGIGKLPISVEGLSCLIFLSLRECKNLASFPSIICSLTSLKYLYLSGCSLIDQLPENLGSLEQLQELYACKTAITKVSSSILLLKKLKRLCLHGCNGLMLDHSFSGLSSLSGCGMEETEGDEDGTRHHTLPISNELIKQLLHTYFEESPRNDDLEMEMVTVGASLNSASPVNQLVTPQDTMATKVLPSLSERESGGMPGQAFGHPNDQVLEEASVKEEFGHLEGQTSQTEASEGQGSSLAGEQPLELQIAQAKQALEDWMDAARSGASSVSSAVGAINFLIAQEVMYTELGADLVEAMENYCQLQQQTWKSQEAASLANDSLEALENQQAIKLSERFEANKQCESTVTAINRLDKEIEAIQAELARKQDQRAALQASLTVLSGDAARLSSQISSIDAQRKDHQKIVREGQVANMKLEKEHRKLRVDLDYAYQQL